MDTDPCNHNKHSENATLYSNDSSQAKNTVVLRVECVSGRTLKVHLSIRSVAYLGAAGPCMKGIVPMQKFLLLQFILRWLAVGLVGTLCCLSISAIILHSA